MVNCKRCGEKFHACCSCSMDHEWEYTYCSEKCFITSNKYTQNKKLFVNFYKSLNEEQQKIYHKIYEDVFCDSDFRYLTEEWIKNG